MTTSQTVRLLGTYNQESQKVLKHLHNDPVDIGGLWEHAKKRLEQAAEGSWSDKDAETVQRWFWEEDLPMAMTNLYQRGEATSRSGDPTFNDVWRGLKSEQQQAWTQHHWVGVWCLFCGVRPQSRDGSDNRPGGITFQIAHRMPWDWMHLWWAQKPIDLQEQLLSHKERLADYFERPPVAWQKIDPLSHKGNPNEMHTRHRVWREWWDLGTGLYPNSTSPFVRGEIRAGLKRKPDVLSQDWYVSWLNAKKPAACDWWVDGVLAFHAIEERGHLERALEALKFVMTEPRRLVLSEALPARLGKDPEADAIVERWTLSLGKPASLDGKTWAL